MASPFPRLSLFFLCLATHLTLSSAPPKVTIVCVVDQCGQHLLNKHLPYLSGGIKQLHEGSLVYTNARHPHARPATATGHAAISTGAFAQKHGIVANEWFDEKGHKTSACDDRDLKKAAVFSPNGTYNKGKSAHRIMTKGLADQLHNHHCISLSLKARAAIGMGTTGAYPVWFDARAGCFTSSKAFGDKKPFWLNTFNTLACRTLHTHGTTQWKPRFPDEHPAYQFTLAEDDRFAGHPFSLMYEAQPLPQEESNKPYKLFCHTPQANKALLMLALHALEQLHKKDSLKPIVLFLSLSSLDFVGHYYGPDSIEVIDMLHHVDAQLERFIKKVEGMFGRTNCCWTFTGDHAGMSIPEILNEKGISRARRIDTNDLIDQLNQTIYTYFNIKNLVLGMDAPDVWFAPQTWQRLSEKQQIAIADHVKGFLSAVDGIKQAWRGDEILSGAGLRGVNAFDRAHWFAKQYYHRRSGQVIFQMEPYTYITEYPLGTSHNSPYDYDVQVPLILKWPGHLPAHTIDSWVTSHQICTTLASLLEVVPPRDANKRLLPGVE